MSGQDFVVIDVETANADLSSICQVGVAGFRDGQLIETWESFVDPEDVFSPVNISIHGIDENRVNGAPNWKNVLPDLSAKLNGRIVVSHTHFDRVALSRACERYDLTLCDCTWLDSATVVRRAWPEFSKSGYGLSTVASHFGILYEAHDALEDARCAGLILVRAIEETGLNVEQWIIRAEQPIHADGIRREGNPDGDLSGEILVFTGALSICRHEAADAAAAAGCRVDAGVTKHTTILVVGDQDIRRLAGKDKSSKHLKAENLILHGQHIRIVGESDFMLLAGSSELPN